MWAATFVRKGVDKPEKAQSSRIAFPEKIKLVPYLCEVWQSTPHQLLSNMTANRRIFLNIVATYGRSLFALLCGLFTARWTLQSLGEVDYGLLGVVGGLTAFIAFFNNLLATAIGRFYAVAVGKAQVSGKAIEGLEECRQWFSIAVFIHTVIPLILMVIGYPIGVWAVRNWLTIPPDRIEACVWVFRCVCLSCFVGMVNVPFTAMYTAKQYIAELTIYSFVTTTVNVCFLYYMVTHPGMWLTRLAVWTMCLSVIPQIIICLRAIKVFPECRFKVRCCKSIEHFKKLSYFMTWWAFGQLGGMLRNQGIQVLINKYFGPKMNTPMALANNVRGHTMTLSGALVGAFSPAIVNAYGAGDLTRMRSLAYQASKMSMILILIFMIPLSLELRKILQLWLVEPPQYLYELALMMFAITIVDQSTVGHMLAVNARGKIAHYQAILGGLLLLTLPVAWFCCALGGNIYWVVGAMLVLTMFSAWGRVWFARSLVGMSARYWLFHIFLPVCITSLVSSVIASLTRCIFPESIGRIILTTLIGEMVFLLLIWFFVLKIDERQMVLGKIHQLFGRVFKRGL